MAASVCHVMIKGEKIFEPSAANGTLSDRRMGTIRSGEKCGTCGSSPCIKLHCGHIILPAPVLFKHFNEKIIHLLKQLCKKCFKTCAPFRKCDVSLQQCVAPTEVNIDNKGVLRIDEQPYGHDRLLSILLGVPSTTYRALGINIERSHPAWCIVTHVQVLPISCRSYGRDAHGVWNAHKWTQLYHKLLVTTDKYLGCSDARILEAVWLDLYYSVNEIADMSNNRNNESSIQSARTSAIMDSLFTKKGLIRYGMFGKTVAHVGRSVIVGCEQLAIDEVGVPLEIAMNLYVMERVFYANINLLRRTVAAGLACRVIKSETDTQIELIDNPFCQSVADNLQYGDMVDRCLQTGDYVAFNRQPTLHAAGFMGFRCVVHTDGYVLKFNQSVITPFNADFDGDEMNISVPATIEGTADVMEIMNVKNYILDANGNTQVGLIQNSITGVYRMTKPGGLLDRAEFMQLCFQGDIDCTGVHPAVWFQDKWMYTTTQLVQLLVPIKCTRVPEFAKLEQPGAQVWVDGRYVSGTLGKKHFGVGGSVIRDMCLKSKDRCAVQICRIQRVVSAWTDQHGITVGMADLQLPETKVDGCVSIREYAAKQMDAPLSDDDLNNLTTRVMVETENASHRHELVAGVNHMRDMMKSGAKGDVSKAAHISEMIGLQTIGGETLPLFYGDRPFANCLPGNMPVNRGFVFGNYLGMISPTEMATMLSAARDSMVCKFLKTADSGTMARGLVLRMIDAVVHYDGSVRDANGIIIQQLYNYDGMDYKNPQRRIDPGTPIGVIASHALAAKITQDMLNTFHHSGNKSKHVATQTAPRVKQLFDCKTSLKTDAAVTIKIDNAAELAEKIRDLSVFVREHTVVAQPNESWVADFEKAFWPLNRDTDSPWALITMDRDHSYSLYELLGYFARGDAAVSNHMYHREAQLLVRINTDVESVIDDFKSGVHAYAVAEDRLVVRGYTLQQAVEKFRHADYRHLHTNDVAAACDMFGIEFANSVMKKEFTDIDMFSSSARHVGLLCDYMTYHGVLSSVGINGLRSTTDSSLTLMLCRDPRREIVSAAWKSKNDDVNTTVSNILTGQKMPMGSTFGKFTLVEMPAGFME